jgi:phosphatidylglycerol---prolipoprotein diacylglyceryl transferase
MIPFLHLGPLSIPTYGLMVAIGLLTAAYMLQFDFNRHRAQFMERGYLKNGDDKSHGDEAFLVIGVVGIAGLVGARLYSVLESPRELFAHPAAVLLSRYGFTWSGSVITTLVALVFLARHFKIPVLEFMDLCSPPAALGYGIGRIGCLLSGDGDYGVPTNLSWGMSFPNGVEPTPPKCLAWGLPADCRVHPTPIYEFLGAVIIAAFLWRMATKSLGGGGSRGEIFSGYLIWTGIARFLVEFIRINPRLVLEEGHFYWIEYETYRALASHSWFSFSNAQVVSLLSIVLGFVLLWRIKRKPALQSASA